MAISGHFPFIPQLVSHHQKYGHADGSPHDWEAAFVYISSTLLFIK